MPDNNKQKPHTKSSSREIEEPYIKVVCEQFEDYLKQRGYQPATAHDYARTLHHRDIEGYMQKTFGCRSIYWLTDDSMLVLVLESFRNRSSLEGRVKNATMRYREFLGEDDRRDRFEMLALSIERELDFKKYLLARGIKENAVQNYVSLLKSSKIADTMQKSFGCPSIYGLNNPQSVKQALVLFSSSVINSHNQFRSACNKYCNWIIDAEGGYEEESERKMEEQAKDIELGQFEEMCDVAMHDNLLKAYNGYVTWYAKEFGEREPNLNRQGCEEHWEMLMKEASRIIFDAEYESLNEHFAEFFTEDDKFRCAHIVKMVIKHNAGDRGWNYWVNLARWKVAEAVYKKGFGWIDGVPQRVSIGFLGAAEVGELSSMSKNLYTNEQIQESVARLHKFIVTPVFDPQYCSFIKPLLSKAEFDRLIDEACKSGSGYEIKIEPVQKEQTGTLENMAMTNLFANSDYNAINDEIESLREQLSKAVDERDVALAKLKEANSEIRKYEEEKSKAKVVDHEELVAEIFCEIALRYMEKNKKKKPEQRTLIKNILTNMISQLKLYRRIPNELHESIGSFDDTEETPSQIEVVMEKHVTTEIGKVEAGATGAIINQSKSKKQ